MKIRISHKLLALLLLTAVVPLTIVAFLLIRIGRAQVETTVQVVHRLEAHATATAVRQFLHSAESRLVADLEGSIDTMLDEDIERAVIWLLNKQDNMITFRIVQVHDAEGRPVGRPVRLPPESVPEELHDHYLVDDGDLATFARRIPAAAALATGEAQVSRVYVNPRRREALVAMSVPITNRIGQATWAVSGEVSLREVQRIVADVTIGDVGIAYVVDNLGRAIAHPEFDRVLAGEALTGNGIVEVALSARQEGSVSFESEGGLKLLGAHAPIFWGGWQLLVQQPMADAYRPVSDMARRAAHVLAFALLAALACGLLLVRSLVGPLREVMDGMQRIVGGRFEHVLPVRTTDEAGDLAAAFNVMGGMLRRYREEVEGWNRELQARVDAKTKALESAQSQLVQSAKLSAIGQLGAGVAHELNNPLAGIVGQLHLLKRRLAALKVQDADRERLAGYVAHVEHEAGRCREIVHGLLSFSQRGVGASDVVDVNAAVGKLLVLMQANARTRGVRVECDLATDLPGIESNESQVQQVLMHVLNNAQQAMPDGGTVTIRTRRRGDGVAIAVTDTGRGIAPEHLDRIFEPFFTTKDVWQSTGLGLSVCYSVVESHGGCIEVESEVGRGSTFTIVLPARPARPEESQPAAEPVGLARGAARVAHG